ncbi:MAG: hypothetical protein K5787_15775 [Lentisphaeria bacterium]|nr:hypothetical protein [Lentisphaeria bacterium]
MTKKNHLPDSLELLLDTMCNTFGAIMFIAISIVIISQLSTKAIKEKAPVEITEEYLEELREKVQKLEEELEEEERKMNERALDALGMPKEKKEKVEQLLALKNESRKLVLDSAEQRREMEHRTEEIEKTENRIDEIRSEIQQIKDEINQKKKLLVQMKQARDFRKKELQKQIAKIEANIKSLEKEAEEKKSERTLRFSMEVSTAGEFDYTVCLRNRRLYSDGKGEIHPVRDNDQSGHFSLIGNGHIISENSDEEFSHLLTGISQRNYVSIWCDQNSYPILVNLRQYLRKKKIKVRFIYTEDFKFYYTQGNVNASY